MKRHRIISLFALLILIIVLVSGGYYLIRLSKKGVNSNFNNQNKFIANSENKPDDFLKGTSKQSEAVPLTSLYLLDDGKLILFKNGKKTKILDDSLTHLFGLSDEKTVWVGKMINNKGDSVDLYSTGTLYLLEVDPVSKGVRKELIFPEVANVFYSSKSNRFVLFRKNESENPYADTWMTQVTILNSAGEKIEEFSEENILTLGYQELYDGTILLLKKSGNDQGVVFLALLPSGRHEARRYQLPSGADRIFFYQEIPLATIEEPSEDYIYRSRLYQIDKEEPSLFLDTEGIYSVEFFDSGGRTYLVAEISGYLDSGVPCSRLLRLIENKADSIINSVSFAFPGAEGKIIYGEPINSCQYLRLWETDLNGENAVLIADDYNYIWHSPPLVVGD